MPPPNRLAHRCAPRDPASLQRGIPRADPAPGARARRRCWVALQPQADVVGLGVGQHAHVVTVAWRPEAEALVVTLQTGPQPMERFGRIEVAGIADDVAIAGLVARCSAAAGRW
jgi:hypothetical protein